MKLSFEEKVKHFEGSVQHDVLDATANALAHDPPFFLGAVRLLAVYFEMIGKYVHGVDHAGQSEHFFKQGCREVMKTSRGVGTDVPDNHLARVKTHSHSDLRETLITQLAIDSE